MPGVEGMEGMEGEGEGCGLHLIHCIIGSSSVPQVLCWRRGTVKYHHQAPSPPLSPCQEHSTPPGVDVGAVKYHHQAPSPPLSPLLWTLHTPREESSRTVSGTTDRQNKQTIEQTTEQGLITCMGSLSVIMCVCWMTNVMGSSPPFVSVRIHWNRIL